MPLRFEPLGDHDRRAFSSGQLDLDTWFRERAGQDQRRNLARVFVAVDEDLGVVGFYSLSTFAIALHDLEPEMQRRLPRYPLVPAVLIGRLARDVRMRGQGLGELLLVDALKRIIAASQTLAIFAVVVDAIDAPAAAFYARMGFKAVPDAPLRLILPLATATQAATQPRE